MAIQTAAAAKNGKHVKAEERDEVKAAECILRIPKLAMQTIVVPIIGTSPYVQNRFWNKAEIIAKQAAGDSGTKTKGKRAPKDFDAQYRNAQHKAEPGWYGIPAPAFRNACISACRTFDPPYAMTKAKLTVFAVPDGYDADGTPLVRMTKGEPEMNVSPVRNDSGVMDMRPRPMWRPGWEATVRMRFNTDLFTAQDVINLLARAGELVGVGEGRHDSKESNGMGWGMFAIKTGE